MATTQTNGKPKARAQKDSESERKRPKCGIVMPISEIDGYPLGHWNEVSRILVEAAQSAGLDASLVSDGDDAGLIHKRIVQNIYDSPILLCDLSSRNPNVMLELGMRLAFDKPTVLVKDERTPFTFDAGVIEHLVYPSDLRYAHILAFQGKLRDKLIATLAASGRKQQDASFLRAFGRFTVQKLEEKEATTDDILLETVSEIRGEMARIRAQLAQGVSPTQTPGAGFRDIVSFRKVAEGVAQDFLVISPGSSPEKVAEFLDRYMKKPSWAPEGYCEAVYKETAKKYAVVNPDQQPEESWGT